MLGRWRVGGGGGGGGSDGIPGLKKINKSPTIHIQIIYSGIKLYKMNELSLQNQTLLPTQKHLIMFYI